MTRKPEDIRYALDTTLSGASHDPTLYNRVVNASKGDTPTVKRKMHVALLATLILLTLSATAVAAGMSISTIQDFFDRQKAEGYSYATVNEAAVVTPVSQRHTSQLMDIQVDQLYLTDQAFYFTLHLTPKDANTLLFPCGSNSSMLDGTEVRYFDLWDTNLTLLQLGPMELDNLDDRNAIIPLNSPQFYQEPDGSYTLLCGTHDQETVKLLNHIGSTALMLRFYIDDCRDRDREWNTLILDVPRIEQQPHGDALN